MRKLRTRFPRSGVKLGYGGSTLLTTIGWKIANLKYIKCQIDTQMVRDLSTKQTLHGSNIDVNGNLFCGNSKQLFFVAFILLTLLGKLEISYAGIRMYTEIHEKG